MKNLRVAVVIAFAVGLPVILFGPTLASAQNAAANNANRVSYVLEADGTWGAAQDAAVAAAGGTIVFRHAASGIATAESEDPRFSRNVKRSGAIARATLDEVVQWQEPTTT